MSAWPDSLQVGPLREWPGVQTPASMRRNSQFRAPLQSTLALLDKEMWQLADMQSHLDSAVLLVAIPANQFRRDGRPYANAKAEHPGVVFSMDTKHGHLSYPSDYHHSWEENLRAVALTLQALRMVDRYGVSRNAEQYRGFLELEATATTSVEQAFATLDAILNQRISREHPAEARSAVRVAKRYAHPDQGGSAEAWHSVIEAERVLREAGRL